MSGNIILETRDLTKHYGGIQALEGANFTLRKGEHVAIRLFDTETAANHAHRQGVIRLLQYQLKEHMKQLNKGLPGMTQLGLQLRFPRRPDLRDREVDLARVLERDPPLVALRRPAQRPDRRGARRGRACSGRGER